MLQIESALYPRNFLTPLGRWRKGQEVKDSGDTEKFLWAEEKRAG
jgi:hypothetical protein